MTKILLTGCGGFIGSNLLEYLLTQKNLVLGMDNDFIKRQPMEKYMNPLNPLYHGDPTCLSNNFFAIWDNVTNIANYHVELTDVDTIYHLAAASDIKRSLADPTWDLKENVLATHAVLEQMRRRDIKNLIFTSTSVVHGLDAPTPTLETGVDLYPISQYAASKIACEVFIHAYSHVYGIKAWIFRLGNVIGKNQHRGVIFDFVKKLTKNQKELEILGDGKQIKSYVHVSDVINALTWIPRHNNNKKSEVYNIASHDQMTVTALADIVCDEMNLSPKYKYIGGDHGWVGDVPQVVLSIDKALSTGWNPKYKCEEAIRRTVNELS